LLFRLDTFGGRHDAEVSRQAGDRLHDRARIIAVAETADETAADLDLVEGNLRK
jgi:hypothetical protein